MTGWAWTLSGRCLCPNKKLVLVTEGVKSDLQIGITRIIKYHRLTVDRRWYRVKWGGRISFIILIFGLQAGMYLLPGGIRETCFTFHCLQIEFVTGVGEWQLRSFVKFKTLRFNEEVKQSEGRNDPWVAYTIASEKSWVSEFKEWSWWDRRHTGLPFCLTSVLEPFEFKDEYLSEIMANGELFKETEIRPHR